MEPEIIKLLLIEDSFPDVLIVKELLRRSGLDFKIDHVSELAAAKFIISQKNFDIILLDLGLPDSYGIETFFEINKVAPSTPVNILTGNDDEDIALSLVKKGAQDYLVKSKFDSRILARSIKYSIERKKSEELKAQTLFRFELLSDTTKKINECNDIPSIHNIICNSICKLVPDSIILIAESHDKKFLKANYVKYTKLPDVEPDDIFNMANLLNSEGPSIDEPGKFSPDYNSCKLNKYPGSFSELISNELPKKTDSETDLLQKINFIYNIGYEWKGKYYCAITIFCRNEIIKENINIIETVVTQASLKINRKKTEQDLLKTIAENEEKQLSKFAADLHDGLGPLISAAKYYIKAMEYCKTDEEKSLTYSHIQKSIDEATVALKELADNLSPHILKNHGLVSALNKYCDKFLQSGVFISINTDMKERLDENIEICVYRVIVELINNTLKYAKAKKIGILINQNEGNPYIEYSDDGIGFDVDKMINNCNGRGLQNIINRVTTFNGSYKFENAKNKGMSVKMQF